MFTLQQTSTFVDWLTSIRDPMGKARILARLRAAEFGHFGDCTAIGEGLHEMRIHCGPGYRVYLTRRREVIYLLLTGGNKSTQQRDIRRARQMALCLPPED